MIAVLTKEEFFRDNAVINQNSGLSIKINKKGIKETIGAGKRFQKLPKKSFAYLRNQIIIDDELIDIRISIMKRIDSNWFWIHHVDEKEKSSKLLDPSQKIELKEI